jgi:hypothetical protein
MKIRPTLPTARPETRFYLPVHRDPAAPEHSGQIIKKSCSPTRGAVPEGLRGRILKSIIRRVRAQLLSGFVNTRRESKPRQRCSIAGNLLEFVKDPGPEIMANLSSGVSRRSLGFEAG